MIGFYRTSAPVDSSYTDRIVIEVAVPRDEGLRKRILGGLVFFFSKLGIVHSGSTPPADALQTRNKLNERKEQAS